MAIINRDTANKSIKFDKKTLHGAAEQKLLCIVIDKGLNFQSHTKPVIKTVNQAKCPYQSRTVYDRFQQKGYI